jgi:hypothetical protein
MIENDMGNTGVNPTSTLNPPPIAVDGNVSQTTEGDPTLDEKILPNQVEQPIVLAENQVQDSNLPLTPSTVNGNVSQAPEEGTLEFYIKESFDRLVESGLTPTQARTKMVLKDGYGENPDPEIANRLVKMDKISTFDSVEDATEELPPNTGYYLTPVGTQKYGTFLRTDDRSPTFWEGYSSMVQSLTSEVSFTEEQLEEFRLARDEIAATGEGLLSGGVNGIALLMQLPFLISKWSPTWNEHFRFFGEALPGEGWGYTKNYWERVESGRTQQDIIMNAIQKWSVETQDVINANIGTPQEDWSRYAAGRFSHLFGEIWTPGGPVIRTGKLAFDASKFVLGSPNKVLDAATKIPSKLISNAIYAYQTNSLSNSLGKAVVATRLGEHLPEASARVWRLADKVAKPLPQISDITKGLSVLALEVDSALGATIAHQVTLALFKEFAPENEYAQLIALPMLLFGAVITPGSLVERASVASQTGLLPRLMYDIGSVFIKEGSPKMEILNAKFLAWRGVSKESIEKMRQNGELASMVISKRLGPRAKKDLIRIRKAMRKLEKTDKGAYDQLRMRMELNIETYTNLMRVAQKLLPKGSRETVSVYMNNILELAYYDTIMVQAMAVKEGLKFTRNLRLSYVAHNMQINKDRIYAANVHLLKNIKENSGYLDNKQFASFIEFAEVSQKRIMGNVQDSGSALTEQLLKRQSKAELEATTSYNKAEEALNPGKLEETYIDTANLQRETISKAFFEDKAVIDNVYGALDLKVPLDATNFRNYLINKLRVGGSEATERAAPSAVRDVGVLDDAYVADDEALDAIRTFAGIDLNGQPLHKIANQLTESGLQVFDEGTVQTLLRQAEDHIGKLRKKPDGSDFDYTTIPKDEAIKAFMSIKDMTVQTLIPANMTIGKLKILMSKIGLEYSKNIGTAKGHALGEYLIRAEAMLDDVPDNLGRNILEYRAAREMFKTQYVPRWLKGIGEKLMRPDVGRGERAISSEAIFQTFFKNEERIGERGEAFLGLLYKLDGTTLRDNADEIIKLMKYGLSRNMENMSPQKLTDIISVYGSRGYNLLGESTEKILATWLERSVRGWAIDKAHILTEGKRLSVLVNDLVKTRRDSISGSGISDLSKATDPRDFFRTESVFVKTHLMTADDAARFADLPEAVSKGEFGIVEKAQEKLGILMGPTAKKGEVAMTMFEYLRRETNGFTTKAGQDMLPLIRNMYAQDIIMGSVNPSGRKLIAVSKDADGNIIPQMEEIIDYAALQTKLDQSKDIRSIIFSTESNETFQTVLKNIKVLAKSTEPSVTVMGLARPYQASAFMARSFAIARGVLSLRYFAGELTIQGVRLQYMHMMQRLLTDPTAVFTLSKMIDDIPNYTRVNYKTGIATLAKFLGVKTSELQHISEEDFNSLRKTGTITAEGYDAAVRRGELRKINDKIKKSREKASEGLSKLMETYG